MKKIHELWKITYTKRSFHEDDLGETYGKEETNTVYEFHYDDCISTYISYCEDGYICSYEKIDEGFTKTVINFDLNLDLAISNMQYAILDGDMEIYKLWEVRAETIKGCMLNLFCSFLIFPFDIEQRYKDYVKEFPKRMLEQAD